MNQLEVRTQIAKLIGKTGHINLLHAITQVLAEQAAQTQNAIEANNLNLDRCVIEEAIFTIYHERNR